MDKKYIASRANEELKILYPSAECALLWGGGEHNAWKLVVMGRLSAQCTDARVNIVCKTLFEAYKTPWELADAPIEDIENIIRPCGLFHTKAADIKSECFDIAYKYNGRVPDTMEELLSLRGVGRKIANLLLGDLYGKGGIVADTHCIRICGRLGMYPETLRDPTRIEGILRELLDPARGSDFCHRIVEFGREFCTARAPSCAICPLADLCEKNIRQNSKNAGKVAPV